MNLNAEFKHLLSELRRAKRDVAQVEESIRQFVGDVAARRGLPYEACLQSFLQSIVDDESPDAAAGRRRGEEDAR